MRFYTLFLSLLFAATSFAQLSEGYYRVQHKYSSRYLYLMDNTGKINISSASADVAAIVPWMGEENMIGDASTIIRIEKMGEGYKFAAQGATTTDILGNYPIMIRPQDDGTYHCYAQKDQIIMYLADTQTRLAIKGVPVEYGTLEVIDAGQDPVDKEIRKWYIKPVDANSDNYFGIKPTFSVEGKHFASFYSDFPFSFVSPGMKAYIVTKNDAVRATLTEVTASVIPAKTPVLIECSSLNPSENRISIGGTPGAVEGNLLSGNFFCYDPNTNKSGETHENLHPVTPTMRVFGITSNGKLGLVTPTYAYLPANTAYLDSYVSGLASELVFEDYIEVIDVTLNKTELTLNVGASEKLIATVNPAEATETQLFWGTDNEKVIQVDQDGTVTALRAGTARVDVRSVNGKFATCNVTVKVDATGVTLDKTALQLKKGATEQLTATVLPEDATDKSVTWTSSNAGVATVSAEGLVTAVGAGSADITVATVNGLTAVCKVDVTVDATGVTLSQTTLDLKKGQQATLTATVAPEDATDKSLTWTTSNEAVATVSANGEVAAVGAGSAVITVTTVNGLTATCTVNVSVPSEGVVLNKSLLNLKKGASEQLIATVLPEGTTETAVTWFSTDETVATVSADGLVTAVGAGVCAVSVQTQAGLIATCKVTVTVDAAAVALDKKALDLKKGEQATLTATVTPEDATDKTLTWKSSNTAVATVADGVVTAVAAGTASIIVSTANGLTDTCQVTVTVEPESITLDKTTHVMEVNTKVTLVATVLPADAVDKTVTWTSSNEALATVSQGGTVSAIAAGEVVITATTVNGLTATCTITIEESSAIANVKANAEKADDAVYSVNGKFVGNSTENLAKGVYIYKGKKITIR